jgi:hypothetical protein
LSTVLLPLILGLISECSLLRIITELIDAKGILKPTDAGGFTETQDYDPIIGLSG